MATIGAATALALMFTPTAEATVVVPLTIEQMSIKSQAVVRARVVNRYGAWDESHRRIHTYTELEVLDRIHGPDSLATVTVRTLGGEVGGVGMKVSGTPKFSLGEEVLLFLRTDPVNTQHFQVIGMSQGKYRVERSAKGAVFAVPGVEGLAFARRGNGGPMKVDGKSDATRVALTTLRARIRNAIAVGQAPDQPAGPTPTPINSPTTVRSTTAQ